MSNVSGREEEPIRNICKKCHYWYRIDALYGICERNGLRYDENVRCVLFEKDRRKTGSEIEIVERPIAEVSCGNCNFWIRTEDGTYGQCTEDLGWYLSGEVCFRFVRR